MTRQEVKALLSSFFIFLFVILLMILKKFIDGRFDFQAHRYYYQHHNDDDDDDDEVHDGMDDGHHHRGCRRCHRRHYHHHRHSFSPPFCFFRVVKITMKFVFFQKDLFFFFLFMQPILCYYELFFTTFSPLVSLLIFNCFFPVFHLPFLIII